MKIYVSEKDAWIDDDIAAKWWQGYQRFIEDRQRIAKAVLHFEGEILRAICEGQGQVTDADDKATTG